MCCDWRRSLMFACILLNLVHSMKSFTNTHTHKNKILVFTGNGNCEVQTLVKNVCINNKCTKKKRTVRNTRWFGTDYWQELNSVFAVHECTPETNREENCCGCDFPFEMLSYVECQADCFDWLRCLLPDRPRAPSLPQRKTCMVIQQAGWSVTSEDHHWMFDSVVSLFITVRHSLHNKGLLISILPACVPCRQTRVCTRSTCWDSMW